MVFESLLQPQIAEKAPQDAFLLSFVLSTVSIMLSLVVFTPFVKINFILGMYTLFFIGVIIFVLQKNFDGKNMAVGAALFVVVTIFFLSMVGSRTVGVDYTPYGTPVSLAIIFFTSLGLAPLMVRLLYVEEKKDITDLEESFILRHKEILLIYGALFVGSILAFSLWFTILPEPIVNSIFEEQISTLNWVSNVRAGLVTGVSASQKLGFSAIVANNIKVLAVATLLSFALGSGAIFILTWNASIIAVAVGSSARNLIAYYAELGHFAGLAAYFHALPLSFSQLILHGSLEIGAYFIGGLAGGILSVALTHHQGKAIYRVVKDSMMLLGVAVGLIVLAGIVEILVMGL